MNSLRTKTVEQSLVVQPSQSDPTCKNSNYYRRECALWSALSACGALLALSSPGFDAWYLAWFGLVPFLIAAFCSRDPAEAFARGFAFGVGYNLNYLSWALNFSPAVWPSGLKPFTQIANIFVWLLFSAQQGVLFGTFSAISSAFPWHAGFSFVRKPMRGGAGNAWRCYFPAFAILPIIWVLIFNKLGNSTGSISVPWSMIEYSQYQQKALLQTASYIGGPGIAAIIVLVNLAIASVVLEFSGKKISCPKIHLPSRRQLLLDATMVALVLGIGLSFGSFRLSSIGKTSSPQVQLSALQGNMLFALDQPNPKKHLLTYLSLARKSPASICIWPEWSMILPVSKFPQAYEILSGIAAQKGQHWILGALDADDKGRTYNAVCTVGGTTRSHIPEVYRKQFLVPFGEYTPEWIAKSPLASLCGTLTPRGQGYSPFDSSGVLSCDKIKIAPLLCCELMKPELTAKGTRAGGQILVDCSNTMWFQSDLLGKQSIAMCAFRAAECHRSFVFASSIGPSAIIDPYGIVRQVAPRNKAVVLTDWVKLESDITPFVYWFR